MRQLCVFTVIEFRVHIIYMILCYFIGGIQIIYSNLSQIIIMNLKMDLKHYRLNQKHGLKLDNPDSTYQIFLKNLAKYHFQVKAIIQDILECRASMRVLNELNEKGRLQIRLLRDELENLEVYANDAGEDRYYQELVSQRHQLSGLLKEFKEANISSMFAIEKAQRDDLLQSVDGDETGVRSRKKKVDRDGLLQMSTGVTEQLLSISRQLAATTQRSQDTLDNLVSSSSAVHGTQSELENTGSTISQSSKLLKKYGRREFTDKVIMFFAFLFFLAVCLYIVQKRLF